MAALIHLVFIIRLSQLKLIALSNTNDAKVATMSNQAEKKHWKPFHTFSYPQYYNLKIKTEPTLAKLCGTIPVPIRAKLQHLRTDVVDAVFECAGGRLDVSAEVLGLGHQVERLQQAGAGLGDRLQHCDGPLQRDGDRRAQRHRLEQAPPGQSTWLGRWKQKNRARSVRQPGK